MIGAIAGRELRILFASPLPWVVLAVTQFLIAWIFLGRMELFMQVQPQLVGLDDAPGLTEIVVAPTFGAAGIVLLMCAPLLTMRAIAEERRSGTLTLLLAAPIASAQIVSGKFLGLLAMFALMALLVGLMPLSLLLGATVDAGQFITGWAALVLLLAAFAAAGLFLSCLTAQPAVAAIAGFGLLLGLWIIDWAGDSGAGGAGGLARLSLARHYEGLLQGVLDSADVAYLGIFTATFVVLAAWRLEAERLGRPGGAGLPGRGPARVRLELWTFAALVLACAALLTWLSGEYRVRVDLTASGRHTLTAASRAVLERIEGPIRVTAYVRPQGPLRERVERLVGRYRSERPELELHLLDPDAVPDEVRAQGISRDGELVVALAGRSERVTQLTEQALSNALLSLARGGDRYVVFLEGHGERSPFGEANHDVGEWGRQLAARGIDLQSLNLTATGAVPDNTSVLVIASPRVSLLPGEVEIITRWVGAGGNVLWLLEPGEERGLAPLAALLGIERVPGTVMDPAARALGIDRPGFTLVTAYPPHPALEEFSYVTVFPTAAALVARAGDAWRGEPLLTTGEQAFSETETADAAARYEAQRDIPGPLNLGLALTRPHPDGEGEQAPTQRVVVIGDGDFLANSYLGNGGNLDLGLRLVNWLARDEHLVQVPARTAGDLHLELPHALAMGLALWFLFGCPLALLAAGVWVWRRRRA